MDDFAKIEADGVEASVELARKTLIAPDSLAKIPSLIKDTARQKALVESQLSTISSAQIEEAKLAMDILNRSNTYVDIVKNDFATIDQLCRDSQALIDNYKLIREAHIALRNVTAARDWLKRLIKLQEEAKELKHMLENPSYLLEAHEKIQQLEALKDAVMDQLENHPEYAKTFEDHFKIIGEVSHQFFEQIWMTIEEVLELAQDDPASLVRVLRVIEREENMDKEFLRTGPASGSKRGRKIRGYMGMCYQHISNSVMRKFADFLQDCKTVEEKLKVLTELLQDLQIVAESVVPCFPESYNIEEYFNTLYQGKTKQIVDDMVKDAKNMTIRDKLSLLNWLDKYYDNMEALGIEDDKIIPLDEDKYIRQLEDMYIADTTTMMIEWSERIINADMQQVETSRTPEGLLYSMAPVDMFKMLDSQIAIARDTRRRRLLKEIVESTKAALRFFQERIMHAVEERFPELSFEQLCAYANNCRNCLEYTDDYQKNLQEIFEDEEEDEDEDEDEEDDYGEEEEGEDYEDREEDEDEEEENSYRRRKREREERIKERKAAQERRIKERERRRAQKEEERSRLDLSTTKKGFNDAAKRCAALVAAHIVNALEEPFKGLFRDPWYKREITATIVDTYRDFFEDAKQYLEEYLFYKVTYMVLEKTVNRYVEGLLDKKNTGSILGKGLELNDEAADLIEQDMEAFTALFEEYFPEDTVDSIHDLLNPIQGIYKIIAAENPDDFHFACVFLLQHFRDVTADVVETIIKMRTNLDKETRKQITDMLRETFETAESAQQTPPPPPSGADEGAAGTDEDNQTTGGGGSREEYDSDDESAGGGSSSGAGGKNRREAQQPKHTIFGKFSNRTKVVGGGADPAKGDQGRAGLGTRLKKWIPATGGGGGGGGGGAAPAAATATPAAATTGDRTNNNNNNNTATPKQPTTAPPPPPAAADTVADDDDDLPEIVPLSVILGGNRK